MVVIWIGENSCRATLSHLYFITLSPFLILCFSSSFFVFSISGGFHQARINESVKLRGQRQIWGKWTYKWTSTHTHAMLPWIIKLYISVGQDRGWKTIETKKKRTFPSIPKYVGANNCHPSCCYLLSWTFIMNLVLTWTMHDDRCWVVLSCLPRWP